MGLLSTPAKASAVAGQPASALSAFATLASTVLDSRMSVAGPSMVYMTAVATSAAKLPRRPAAAALSVVALNFFFVPLRGALAVDGAEYWWILMALLALTLGLGAFVRVARGTTSRCGTRSRKGLTSTRSRYRSS